MFKDSVKGSHHHMIITDDRINGSSFMIKSIKLSYYVQCKVNAMICADNYLSIIRSDKINNKKNFCIFNNSFAYVHFLKQNKRHNDCIVMIVIEM